VPDVNTPPASDGPSRRALLRSTAIAAAAALLILVTVVLPAEYGIDPTRVGRLLGLAKMGETKAALAREAAADEAADRAAEAADSASAEPPPGADSIAPNTPRRP
jgi:hypothetical protein